MKSYRPETYRSTDANDDSIIPLYDHKNFVVV